MALVVRAARLATLLCILTALGCGGSRKPVSNIPAGPVEHPVPNVILGLGTHCLEDPCIAEQLSLNRPYTRHTLYPPLWYEKPGYSHHFKERAKAAHDRGLKLLLVVHPALAGWGPEDFAAFMGRRARDMPFVEVWQIGNEADLGPNHREFHRLAYDSIKAADPDALVVTYALPTIEHARAWDAPTDALVVHTYGWPLAPRIKELRAWLGDRLPVWITEFGVERKVIGMDHPDWEAEQLRQWKEAIETAARAGFARVYGYQIRTDEPHETHGIIRPDGTLRPTAEWLKGQP